MQIPAYLFDVDGVLTDPEAKRVVKLEIFDEIIKRLKRGMSVGLNTGRSLAFINDRILQPLEKMITNQTLTQKSDSYWRTGRSLHQIRPLRTTSTSH